jgi:hypothetical protein
VAYCQDGILQEKMSIVNAALVWRCMQVGHTVKRNQQYNHNLHVWHAGVKQISRVRAAAPLSQGTNRVCTGSCREALDSITITSTGANHRLPHTLWKAHNMVAVPVGRITVHDIPVVLVPP